MNHCEAISPAQETDCYTRRDAQGRRKASTQQQQCGWGETENARQTGIHWRTPERAGPSPESHSLYESRFTMSTCDRHERVCWHHGKCYDVCNIIVPSGHPLMWSLFQTVWWDTCRRTACWWSLCGAQAVLPLFLYTGADTRSSPSPAPSICPHVTAYLPVSSPHSWDDTWRQFFSWGIFYYFSSNRKPFSQAGSTHETLQDLLVLGLFLKSEL